MIFSLSTNKIFKNNDLVFENKIKTEINKMKMYLRYVLTITGIIFGYLDYDYVNVIFNNYQNNLLFNLLSE